MSSRVVRRAAIGSATAICVEEPKRPVEQPAKRPKGVQREQARRKYFRAAASPFSSASSVLSPVKV